MPVIYPENIDRLHSQAPGYTFIADYAKKNNTCRHNIYNLSQAGKIPYKRIGKFLIVKEDAPMPYQRYANKGCSHCARTSHQVCH